MVQVNCRKFSQPILCCLSSYIAIHGKSKVGSKDINFCMACEFVLVVSLTSLHQNQCI